MYRAGEHAHISHPRPDPPREGEGDFVRLDMVANQEERSGPCLSTLFAILFPFPGCSSRKEGLSKNLTPPSDAAAPLA